MSEPAPEFHGHAHHDHVHAGHGLPGLPAEPPAGVTVRHDWTLAEVRAVHDLPLFELVFRAQALHRQVFPEHRVQLCSLLSIKTGGCSEDCAYCSQAARYSTGVKAEKLLTPAEVIEAAKAARSAGATRFCMGAAWREVKDGPAFDQVLQMVRGVRALGMEACCTLGMLTDTQARRLKEAGLSAYNHNLDTSPAHYHDVITTRTFEDRLATLRRVRSAGIAVCSGGIIGMAESVDDRCEMLRTLANQEAHPESVPVNALVPVEGTPLAGQAMVKPIELVRAIATARLLMPLSFVRLSAGRAQMTQEAQLLCLLAGANSIFFGEKLLTTGNPGYDADLALLAEAGIRPLEPNPVR